MLDTVQTENPWSGSAGPRDSEAVTGLRRAQAFLARRWLVVSLTVALVLVAAGLALHTVAPRFTAHAEILLDPRREKAFGTDDTPRLISLDTSDIESAILAIKAHRLLSQVVEDIHLASNPEFNGAGAIRSRLKGMLGALLGSQARPPLSQEAQALATLFRNLRVERVGKAYALAISVTALHPELAARLANAVADAFVRDERNARLESTRRAAVFFAERLGPLGEHLRLSEEALERFRRDHDLIAKTASAQGNPGPSTINEQQLGELNTRLASARAEGAQAWARYDQARTLQARGGLIESVPDVVRSTLIGQLREQQAEVARKEADLAVLWRKRHSGCDMITLEANLILSTKDV